MRRLKSSAPQRAARLALLLLLAALSLAQQSPTRLLTPEMKRVGEKLACKCGTCNNTVANCPMLECHYALPAREKIASALAAGQSDQSIIDGFVKEYGLSALAAPPAEGFSLLSWVMPFVVLAIGLGMIWLYIRRLRKPQPLPEVPPLDPKLRDRYEERIEKELADLD